MKNPSWELEFIQAQIRSRRFHGGLGHSCNFTTIRFDKILLLIKL